MVSRLEIFLGVMLLLALGLGFANRTEITRAKQAQKEIRKTAELFEARSREVNATGVKNEFAAVHATLIGKTWWMENFQTHNADIRLLCSRKAMRNDRLTRLDGNVTLIRTDGAVFRAETVIYDRQKKTLNSIGPFFGQKGANYVKGIDFFYEIVPKRTRAERVFAHYLLKDVKQRLR
ncbi:hypothetical protein [Nitratifractor sp.]|uniref:hypothetical protein n=1 Tax=Nitratifractor sp. TaxID=2268144 RepID=UPI0025D1F2B6|nr:hypothetical protein [Nitratifractor sp.]